MRPAVSALGRTREVRTFSLNEENGTTDPFPQWLARIDQLIDRTHSARAVIIGVSFGGLVAAHFAARRPDRVAALVLVSAPSPRMRLGLDEQRYLRRPRATLPLFALRAATRLWPELKAAHATWTARLTFATAYGWQVLRKPVEPARMARWVQAWQARDLLADCASIAVPTRLITGEPHLDRVVPTTSTLEYLSLIPGATAAVLPRAGHIGLVSRPAAFAALVEEFLTEVAAVTEVAEVGGRHRSETLYD